MILQQQQEELSIVETMLGFLTQRFEHVCILILVLLNSVIMYVAYITNMDILPSLKGTPIYVAFEDPTSIYFGITVNIATCIPTIMELIMDIKYYRDLTLEDETGVNDYVDSDSWIERFFLAILSIVPGAILLLLRHDVNAPYIYAIVHVLQFFGSIGMVLLICKKQVPKYFRSTNIICAMILFTVGIICSMMGFGHDILYVPNILTILFLMGGFYVLLVQIGYPWLRDVWVHSVSKRKPLSIEESCAMWYFLNTVAILVVVHGLVCLCKLYDWTSFDSLDMNVFVYSFALYSVINSTVPGRLARIAAEKERKKMVQTKRALIRYLSHEVRSPLNVIHSGLNLLVEDVDGLPPSAQKESVKETFASIRHASGDLLQTMNDLLLLESMDSAAFSVQEKMVPCADLTHIADKCGVMPREKGIAFHVNNHFLAPDKPDLGARTEQPDPHSRDIERGPDPQPEPEQQLLLFIDEHKIGQVLRNLITNSAKFTPPGRSIAVNIRPATSADLTQAASSESKAVVDSRLRAQTFARENGFLPCGQVLLEVQDTGAGIAPEHWAKVFGQFAQFDASKLQGGGGSGLGLWICQQLVGLHGSQVRFHSDGEGRGTRFFFTLPSYSCRKGRPGGGGDVDVAATAISQQQQQQPPLLSLSMSMSLSLSARWAQVGPEEEPADRFSRIVSRPLGRAGLCRVLLVDDSRVNVSVMKKMLVRVSATWTPSPSSNNNNNEEEEEDGEEEEEVVGMVGEEQGDCDQGRAAPLPLGQQMDGSSVCLFQEAVSTPAPAVPTPAPVPDSGSRVSEVGAVRFAYSEADDGPAAVQMVRAAGEQGAPFDIVFMDNIMVRMHGPEAAQAMRAAGFAGLVVGVTGNVMAENVLQYMQSGADHVLGKPVNMDDLKQILNRLTAH